MEVILYTTHCPKCKVLTIKLKQKGIEFQEEEDLQKMIAMGMKSAPALYVDGKKMDFSEAIKWIKEQPDAEVK